MIFNENIAQWGKFKCCRLSVDCMWSLSQTSSVVTNFLIGRALQVTFFCRLEGLSVWTLRWKLVMWLFKLQQVLKSFPLIEQWLCALPEQEKSTVLIGCWLPRDNSCIVLFSQSFTCTISLSRGMLGWKKFDARARLHLFVLTWLPVDKLWTTKNCIFSHLVCTAGKI